MDRLNDKVYARLLIGLLLIFIAGLCISGIRMLLVPLLLSGIISVVLVPFNNSLQRKGISKNGSAFIPVVTVVISGVIVFYILTVPLIKSANNFLVSLPTFMLSAQRRFGILRMLSQLGIYEMVVDGSRLYVAEMISVSSVIEWLGYVVKGLYVLFLLPVFSFYFLRDRRNMIKTIQYFVPESQKNKMARLVHEIYLGINTYISGYLFISCLCFILSIIAFGIIDLESYLFLSVFMGICSFVPFIGPLIGGVPAMVVASGYGWKLWYVLFVILVIFQFTASFLTPKTVGNSVNIHPIFGISAMMLGYSAFGVLGIVVAVPILVIIRPIVKYILSLVL